MGSFASGPVANNPGEHRRQRRPDDLAEVVAEVHDEARLGSGRVVASEIEAPTMLTNTV